MTEYNLTWKEAKEAMRRGAVVNCGTLSNFKLENENLYLKLIDKGWILASSEYLDNYKWRIVELTDCILFDRCHPYDHNITCHTHAERALHQKTHALSKELINDNCIKKFTEQLKEDMAKSNVKYKVNIERHYQFIKNCDVYYYKTSSPFCDARYYKCLTHGTFHKDTERGFILAGHGILSDKCRKIEEQKMKEPKIYSFEKALSGMRHGKFYQDEKTKKIYRLSDKFYLQTYHGEWVDSRAEGGLPIFMLKKFVEIENPEKKEPEKVYNELSITTDLHGFTPAVFQFAMFGEMLNLGFNSEQKMKSFIKALQTFLRLKAHPLAVKPSRNDQCYIVCNLDDGNVCSYYASEYMDKGDYISPMFSDEKDSDKAIQDIGEDNLVEMFKVFSGDYE
jgi:hypothetical protein